jgi:hypothetical protein
VPENVIGRRFAAGLSNFFTLVEPVANSWQMIDNSEAQRPRLIAARKRLAESTLFDKATWRHL